MLNNSLTFFRSTVLCTFCSAILIFVSVNPAFAQDWRLEPILRAGTELDDNATLDPRTDEEVNLSGFLFEGRADIYYSSPRTEFFIQPKALVRDYDNEAVLDSTDYFLRSDFDHETGSNTFGFLARYDRQAVRNAERLVTDLEDEEPDDITNDDTGRVIGVGTRNRWRLSPDWEYRLSNLSSIRADIKYVEVQYEDVPPAFLADYSDVRLNLEFRRALSNITSWGVVVSGRTYESERFNGEIESQALSVNVSHALSEKTIIDGNVGIENTDVDGFDIDPEVIGHLRLTRRLELIRLFAEYRRSVYGNGSGVLSARDSINLNFQRRLNERISSGLAVRAYQTSRIGGAAASQERTYVQLQSNLTWYLSKSFVVEADYRYTVINRGENFGGAANSNQIMIWLVYQPKTIPKI